MTLPEPWGPAAVAAFLGLFIGSFLNVCIYRLPRDLSVVRPRSFCPVCGASVIWHDNIPLLSFILLGRRCRTCRTALSWLYPVVELATALLFAAAALLYGVSLATLRLMVLLSVLIVLFWTDWRDRILPDECTLGGLVAGLLFAFAVSLTPAPPGGRVEPGITGSLLGAALFGGALWLLRVIYWRLRRREGLGLGDVKLGAMLGSFLGWRLVAPVLLAGSLGGSVAGLIWLAASKHRASEYPLPFGSFLCLAGVLVAFWPEVMPPWLGRF